MAGQMAKRLTKIHSVPTPHKPPKVAGTRPPEKVQPAGLPAGETRAVQRAGSRLGNPRRRRASARIAQARGDPGDGDQQRLFQRAVQRRLALARACQQLGLQLVEGVQVGIAQADEFQGLRAVRQ